MRCVTFCTDEPIKELYYAKGMKAHIFNLPTHMGDFSNRRKMHQRNAPIKLEFAFNMDWDAIDYYLIFDALQSSLIQLRKNRIFEKSAIKCAIFRQFIDHNLQWVAKYLHFPQKSICYFHFLHLLIVHIDLCLQLICNSIVPKVCASHNFSLKK